MRSTKNAVLQPYMVSSIVSYGVEGVMICSSTALYWGLARTGKRRRRLDEKRAALERARAEDPFVRQHEEPSLLIEVNQER